MDDARQYGHEGLTLPHDVVKLPSGGVFYRNKKKSVKVGYLTASDENILLAGGSDLTLNLLRTKIYEPDIRPEDMLDGDIEAILIFLRNTAFGPDMEITVTDPATRKPFKTNVRLDELTIINGESPNEDGTFTTVLPKSGSEVKLRPLTFGEISEIAKLASSYPQGRVAPTVTMRLQRQIVSIDGVLDKGEIAKEIEKLPIADSKHIKKFLSENEPRLDMTKVITAPSGEMLTIEVGFGADFFRPFF